MVIRDQFGGSGLTKEEKAWRNWKVTNSSAKTPKVLKMTNFLANTCEFLDFLAPMDPSESFWKFSRNYCLSYNKKWSYWVSKSDQFWIVNIKEVLNLRIVLSQSIPDENVSYAFENEYSSVTVWRGLFRVKPPFDFHNLTLVTVKNHPEVEIIEFYQEFFRKFPQ